MDPVLSDIQTEGDVRAFVDAFYDKVVVDDLLAPIFVDLAKVDFGHHLPTMYAFWSAILLNKPGYHGAPFPVHAQYREHLSREHFARWLELFQATIDSLFTGPVAESAKQRAQNIAMVFQAKLGMLTPEGK